MQWTRSSKIPDIRSNVLVILKRSGSMVSIFDMRREIVNLARKAKEMQKFIAWISSERHVSFITQTKDVILVFV